MVMSSEVIIASVCSGDDSLDHHPSEVGTPVARPVAVAVAADSSATVAAIVDRELTDHEKEYAHRLVPTMLYFALECPLLAYAPIVAATSLLRGLAILFFLAPATAVAAFIFRPYDRGLVEFHVRLTFAKVFFYACFALLSDPRALGLLFLLPSLLSAYLSFRLFALLKIIGDDDDIKSFVLNPRYHIEVWSFWDRVCPCCWLVCPAAAARRRHRLQVQRQRQRHDLERSHHDDDRPQSSSPPGGGDNAADNRGGDDHVDGTSNLVGGDIILQIQADDTLSDDLSDDLDDDDGGVPPSLPPPQSGA